MMSSVEFARRFSFVDRQVRSGLNKWQWLCAVLVLLIASVGQAGGEDPQEEVAPGASQVSEATESVEGPHVLRDPNLLRLLRIYATLSPGDRKKIQAELRKPEVREEIRQVLQNPERLKVIEDERPELYQRFEKHRRLRQQYWELLKKYHESRDSAARERLKEEIRDRLAELVDVETAWYRGQLEWLKQKINWLEKRLDERLRHRSDLIRRQLERDLEKLPPPPRFRRRPPREGRGPEAGRGRDVRLPRGPRDRPPPGEFAQPRRDRRSPR